MKGNRGTTRIANKSRSIPITREDVMDYYLHPSSSGAHSFCAVLLALTLYKLSTKTVTKILFPSVPFTYCLKLYRYFLKNATFI